MKKVFLIIAVASFLASCNSGTQGQLVGARGKKWHPEKPYGMTEVPGGSFIMGKSDDDIAGLNNAPTKTVTVRSFYMDETEITNAEYRQFVHWVRDSIVRQKLAEAAEIGGGGGGDADGGNGGSIQDYAFKGSQQEGGRNNGTGETTETPYQQYSIHYDPNKQRLNWDPEILWATAEYPDQDYVAVMDEIYLPDTQSYNGQRLMDVTKFEYSYKTMDIEAAARAQGDRSQFIKEEKVQVYPLSLIHI